MYILPTWCRLHKIYSTMVISPWTTFHTCTCIIRFKSIDISPKAQHFCFTPTSCRLFNQLTQTVGKLAMRTCHVHVQYTCLNKTQYVHVAWVILHHSRQITHQLNESNPHRCNITYTLTRSHLAR